MAWELEDRMLVKKVTIPDHSTFPYCSTVPNYLNISNKSTIANNSLDLFGIPEEVFLPYLLGARTCMCTSLSSSVFQVASLSFFFNLIS